MRHSRIFLYTASALLCAAGILTAIVGSVWAGGASRAPGASAAGGAASPSPVQAISMPQASFHIGGTSAPQGVISDGMSIFWVSKYTLSGDEVDREEPVDPILVGKTYAQFAASYPNYAMELTNGTIRMVVTYNQYSPNHYIIKSDDAGNIFVYRNMEGRDKLSVVMKMNFTTSDVPQDYVPLLKDGMVFDSVEEIEGLIESAET